jgi:hypothetical protein
METRYIALILVLLVTAVLLIRGAVGLANGEIGTVARQTAIGVIVFSFGVALVYRWDDIG